MLLPVMLSSHYACLASAQVMHAKYNNLSMSISTLVWGNHEHLLCHVSGTATMIENIVSQVALGDRSDASKAQSTSLLWLGPPGVGKLTDFAHQVGTVDSCC